jgi:hypothetical protein
MDWIFANTWAIPLAVSALATIGFFLLCPSLGDSGPDGAAEFSILVMLWIGINLVAWVAWLVCKIIF